MAINFGKLEFEVSLESTSAFPIDKRIYFESYDDAVKAAKTAIEAGGKTSYYFYGETFIVYDPSNNITSFYQIQADGTLKKVGIDHFSTLEAAESAVANSKTFGVDQSSDETKTNHYFGEIVTVYSTKDNEAGLYQIQSDSTLKKIATTEYVDTAIATEASTRESADTALQANITAEETARKEADEALKTEYTGLVEAVSSDVSELSAALVAEQEAREAADDVLKESVETEASTRESADTALQANITAEETARKAADEELKTSIETEASTRESADTTLTENLNSEVSRATLAEENLTAALASEVERATAAEDKLTTSLNDETERATLAEQSIQSSLAEEVSRATNVESSLESSIETLDGNAVKKIGGVSQTIEGDLILTGNIRVSGTTYVNDTQTLLINDNIIVTNAQGDTINDLSGFAIRTNENETYGIMYDPAADSVKLGLGTITNSDGDQEFEFNSGEGKSIVLRDGLVDGNLIKWDSSNSLIIDSGKSVDDIETTIADLSSSISIALQDETDARTTSDSEIKSLLEAETTRATEAESSLQASITAEEAARKAADEELKTSIETEKTERESADTTLQEKITAEATTREEADKALEESIANEATARQTAIATAEAGLSSQIDAISDNFITTENFESEKAEITNSIESVQQSLSEEASTREEVISEINGTLVEMNASLEALTADIESEASTRGSADTTLQENIDAEKTAREAADAELKVLIEAISVGNGSSSSSDEASKVSNPINFTFGSDSEATTYDGSEEVNINIPEYFIVEQETPEEGYRSSYYLTKNGEKVGVTINIPEETIITDASVKTVVEEDDPYTGAILGEKYIDFQIGTDMHIYLAVNDILSTYSSSAAININDENSISLVLSQTTNGLSILEDGLSLSLASSTENGAMSSDDKIKLDHISLTEDNIVSKADSDSAGNKIVDTYATKSELSEKTTEISSTLSTEITTLSTGLTQSIDSLQTDVDTLESSVEKINTDVTELSGIVIKKTADDSTQTIGTNLIVNGNLTVNGTSTQNDLESYYIKENFIFTNSDAEDLSENGTQYSGIVMVSGTTTTKDEDDEEKTVINAHAFLYDHTENTFKCGDGTVSEVDGVKNFSFDNSGYGIIAHAPDNELNEGDILVWDDSNKRLVAASGLKKDTVVTKDILGNESYNLQEGTITSIKESISNIEDGSTVVSKADHANSADELGVTISLDKKTATEETGWYSIATVTNEDITNGPTLSSIIFLVNSIYGANDNTSTNTSSGTLEFDVYSRSSDGTTEIEPKLKVLSGDLDTTEFCFTTSTSDTSATATLYWNKQTLSRMAKFIVLSEANGDLSEDGNPNENTITYSATYFGTSAPENVTYASTLEEVEAPSTSLEGMSWDDISSISKAGNAASFFHIGQEKKITLSDGTSVTAVILGFNHDICSDSTKAGITFGIKNAYTTSIINSSSSNVWSSSDMKQTVLPGVKEKLPTSLQNVLLSVSKKTSAGGSDEKIVTADEDLFLLSHVEVFGTYYRTQASEPIQYSYSGEGHQYEYFKGKTWCSYYPKYTVDPFDNSVAYSANVYYQENSYKALGDDGSESINWWLRSPYFGNSALFCYVSSDGSVGSGGGSDTEYGLSFAFCV